LSEAIAYVLNHSRESGYIHIHTQSRAMLPDDAIVLLVGTHRDLLRFFKVKGQKVPGMDHKGRNRLKKDEKKEIEEAILAHLKDVMLNFTEFNLRLPTPEEGFPLEWEQRLAMKWIENFGE
jgi:hypothetical protein